MISRCCLAIVLILLPLISSQSQTETTSKSPLDKPEVAEAAKLAVEAAQLYKQGKYKEALPIAKRCLQIRERAFTPADEALRTALNNLAEVYLALGKYGDAEPLFQRLIKSYEEFAPADARLVRALQRMGLIKFVAGEHDKTERLYRRALEITEKAYAPDDPKVASAASYLAEYYQAVGNFKKAEPLYQRIFAITEKHTPTGDSEDFRQARDRYACLLHKIGREEQAREVEDRGPLAGTGSTPVMGSVINGRAISIPKPPYPDEARAARVSGTVVVRVVIDEKGNVIRACAMQGPSLLMHTSEAAAFNAVFTPTKLSGQPVKVTGIINYNFVAQ
jgi:DNA-binding SARP family transcriptional activator